MSATTVTVERTGIGARLWSLLSSRETGIFIAFALVVLATTMKNPTFLFSADGWRDLLLTPASSRWSRSARPW